MEGPSAAVARGRRRGGGTSVGRGPGPGEGTLVFEGLNGALKPRCIYIYMYIYIYPSPSLTYLLKQLKRLDPSAPKRLDPYSSSFSLQRAGSPVKSLQICRFRGRLPPRTRARPPIHPRTSETHSRRGGHGDPRPSWHRACGWANRPLGLRVCDWVFAVFAARGVLSAQHR